IRTAADRNYSYRPGGTLLRRWSVEYFRDIVFNYPTLAEAYTVAALDGQAVRSPTEGALSVFSMDRCLRKATPPFFQPTARPTKCRVLHDLRCVGSLRISCKLL